MSLRAPTPSRSTPTPSGPSGSRTSVYAASLEAAAKQQSHVDELIVKNRTLEHTVEKLRTALNAEETRSRDAVQKIQQKWEAEREEWREGCDALQAAHRVAHLRTAIECDKERMEVLRGKERDRQERLKKLQRDFQLVMFQIGESKQEHRIRELEDELEQAQEQHRWGLQELRQKSKGELSAVNAKQLEMEAQLAEQNGEVRDLRNELAQAEARPFSHRYTCDIPFPVILYISPHYTGNDG